MPIYTIQNTETDDVFEVNMKYSDLESYFKENPSYKQLFTRFPGIGDSVRLGMRKPDDGFRDVLRNVQHHHKKDSVNTF